jgi:hypothetical protein
MLETLKSLLVTKIVFTSVFFLHTSNSIAKYGWLSLFYLFCNWIIQRVHNL